MLSPGNDTNQQLSKEAAIHAMLRLALVENIGPSNGKKLISYLGGAEAVFRASKREIAAIDGLGEMHHKMLHEKDTRALAEKTMQECADQGIDIIHYQDSLYPNRLKHCMDSPIILYFEGNTESLKAERCVSIVGTRMATRYGEEFTDEIVKQLVPKDILVTSGLAFGIDITAHKSVMKYGGSTIGIVAHGLDRMSPVGHKVIADKMKEKGGVLSEHRLGVKVEIGHYPMRNRIVAGIADAVIVIESDKRGGSLITAQMANDYNRDVFALPGRYDDQYSRGCNLLIQRNQAHILNDMDEFFKMMSWEEEQNTSNRQIPLFVELEGQEEQIYSLLNREPKTVDVISLEAELPVSKVSSTLLTLEFKGLVRSLPGKQYVVSFH